MRAAVAGGRAAFKVNCVQCHGSGAAGVQGLYPNLNDDDWLWGGDLVEIEKTITDGIRQPEHDGTRFSQMPAFGRDGILTAPQIASVVNHVLSLSGKGPASAQGAALFATELRGLPRSRRQGHAGVRRTESDRRDLALRRKPGGGHRHRLQCAQQASCRPGASASIR